MKKRTIYDLRNEVRNITNKYNIKNKMILNHSIADYIYELLPNDHKREIENTLIMKFKSTDDVLEYLADVINKSFYGVQRIITVDELKGKRRNRDIVNVRHYISYFLVTEFEWTRQYTGLVLGGRDHSTVINSIDKINIFRDNYHDEKRRYKFIKGEIDKIRFSKIENN